MMNGNSSHSAYATKAKRAPSFDTKSQAYKWLTSQWLLGLSDSSKGISPYNSARDYINNIYSSQSFLHQYNKANWYTNYIKHRANFLLEQEKHGARKKPAAKKVRSKFLFHIYFNSSTIHSSFSNPPSFNSFFRHQST